MFVQLPDALHAESFVSGLIGQFQHRLPDAAALSDVLLDLVDALERAEGPEQYALLRTLAAIGPARVAEAARSAADQVLAGAGPHGADWHLPAWLPSVGQVTPGTCRRWTDRFGEVEHLLVTYRYAEDGPEHALYVTRDHSWHGTLWTSALVTEDHLDKVRDEFGRQACKEGVEAAVIPVREAHDAMRDAALAFLEHRHGPPETGDGWPGLDFFENLTLTVYRGQPSGPTPPMSSPPAPPPQRSLRPCHGEPRMPRRCTRGSWPPMRGRGSPAPPLVPCRST